MPRWRSWSPSSTRWQRTPSSSRVMTRNRTSCSTGQSPRANKTQQLSPQHPRFNWVFGFLTYAAFSFFGQLSTFKEWYICLIIWYSKTLKYLKNTEFSCFIFYFSTFSTIFSSSSQFSRRVILSRCNKMIVTVLDENIDISFQIHDFTKKKKIWTQDDTEIWMNHNIFRWVVNISLFISNQK